MTLYVKLVVDIEVDVALTTDAQAQIAAGIIGERVDQTIKNATLAVDFTATTRVDGWEVQ